MPYRCWADFYGSSGTVRLTPDDFASTGNSISAQASKSSFIGSIITRSVHLTIIDRRDQLRGLPLGYDTVTFDLKTSNVSSLTPSRFLYLGRFVVTNHHYYGDSTVEIEAIDYTMALNKIYVPSITFPNSIRNIIPDVCTQCRLRPAHVGYDHLPDITINQPPTNYTCAEIMSSVAEMVGGVVLITDDDYNELFIGRLQSESEDYFEFSEWAQDDLQSDYINHTIGTVIAKVKTQSAPQGEYVTFGDGGNVYRFDSPIELFEESYFEDNIAPSIIGKSYCLFSGNLYEYEEYLEFLGSYLFSRIKICTIQNGLPRSFYSYITNATYSFLGNLTLSCDIENDNSDYSSQAQTEARNVAEQSLEKNQGSANAGKVMVIDQTGNAVPQQLDDFSIQNWHGYYQTHDGLLIQWGTIEITPDAPNTPTIGVVTYPLPFANHPSVQLTAVTASPQQVFVGTNYGSSFITDPREQVCVVLTRAAGGATTISWRAIGKAAN